MASAEDDKSQNRVGMINAVKGPLGFFTLVVLVTEFMLTIITSKAEGVIFNVLAWSMIVLIFSLVAIVFYFAARRPGGLSNQAHGSAKSGAAEVRERETVLQEQLRQSRDEVATLKELVGFIESLELQVLAVLSHDQAKSLAQIVNVLGVEDWDAEAKRSILSILGRLIEAKKAHVISGSYYTLGPGPY